MSSVAVSPDGRTAATGSFDKSIILWDISKSAQPGQIGSPLIGHRNAVQSVGFSGDGNVLATGGDDNTVMLWNVARPAQPPVVGRAFEVGYGAANSVAVSPSAGLLATATRGFSSGARPRGPTEVQLWNIAEGTAPVPLGDPFRDDSTMAFSPTGRTLAVGNEQNGSVDFWDITDPVRPRRTARASLGQGDFVEKMTFLPDGTTLATLGADGAVTLWNAANPGQVSPVGTAHSSGKQQVTGTAIAVSPNGKVLAVAGDQVVELWKIDNRAHPQQYRSPLTSTTLGFNSVAFSPDGHTLAAANGDRTTTLWDVRDPDNPKVLGQPLAGQIDELTSVAFSPSGSTLATGSVDHTVLLWDVSDPARPYRLADPIDSGSSWVDDVAFSVDGTALMVANYDTSVTRWNLAGLDTLRANALQQACSRTAGGPNRQEWDQYVTGFGYRDACSP